MRNNKKSNKKETRRVARAETVSSYLKKAILMLKKQTILYSIMWLSWEHNKHIV